MKNFKYIVMSIVGYIIYILLQINIFSKLPILDVIPNMYVILIIYMSIFEEDKISSNILVVLFGLIQDICFGKVLGLSVLIGLVILNVTPIVSNKKTFETKIGMMTYVLIVTFITEVFTGIFSCIIFNITFELGTFISIVLITSIYNFILALLIHPILSESIKNMNNDFKLVRRY